MLMIHKPKSENKEITTIRTSSESYFHWKHLFQNISLYFRIITIFEADNETDKSSIGSKTTNSHKQNPVCNGYYLISELNEVLQCGYYESLLDYDNVDWFINEF